jgi:arginase
MRIAIICVPYQNDMARWGFACGPRALLDAGLVRRLEERGHQVAEPVWIELPREERTRDTVTNLGRIAARTSAAVAEALSHPETFVVALEGDCTHSLGPMGGLARARGASPGVIWFDAHGDMNTRETSTSGMWGGMPYAVALGWDLEDWREAAGLPEPVRPKAAALVGTSDLDPAEEDALRRHPLLHLTAEDMAAPDTAQQLEHALRQRAKEAPAWYVHIDVDVAGPEAIPGALTPAPHWPSRDALLGAATAAGRAVSTQAASLAAYTPSGDTEQRGAQYCLDLLLAVVEGAAAREGEAP